MLDPKKFSLEKLCFWDGDQPGCVGWSVVMIDTSLVHQKKSVGLHEFSESSAMVQCEIPKQNGSQMMRNSGQSIYLALLNTETCWVTADLTKKTLKLTTQISWIIDLHRHITKKSHRTTTFAEKFLATHAAGSENDVSSSAWVPPLRGNLALDTLLQPPWVAECEKLSMDRWTQWQWGQYWLTDREKNGEILVITKWGQWKWGFGCLWTKPLLNRTNSHDRHDLNR